MKNSNSKTAEGQPISNHDNYFSGNGNRSRAVSADDPRVSGAGTGDRTPTPTSGVEVVELNGGRQGDSLPNPVDPLTLFHKLNSLENMLSQWIPEIKEQIDGIKDYQVGMEEFKNNIQEALNKKFTEVDNRLNEHDSASIASVEEIKLIEEFVTGEQQERIKEQQQLLNNQETLYNETTAFSSYKRELEEEMKLLKIQREELAERERLLEARISAAEKRVAAAPTQKTITNSSETNPTEYSEDGDVKMKDWFVRRYEEKVPTFDNLGIDFEGFKEKCLRHFKRYPLDYDGNEKAKVSFIEDHIGGKVIKWYRLKERKQQRIDPNSEVLFKHLEEKFPPESPVEVSRSKLWKLRHNWGQAYEYLATFNDLADVLELSEGTRKQLLFYQVRPSVREAF